MKTIVSVQDLLELEIKPDALLSEFYTLTREDVKQMLAGGALVDVPCPACGSSRRSVTFEKLGLTYCECRACATLYVSPRPTETTLNIYYRDSRASRFWRERVLPATEEVRLEKIVQPRVQWVLDGLAEYAPESSAGMEVSSHGRVFVHELLAVEPRIKKIIAAHPLADVDFVPPMNRVTVVPRALSDVGVLGTVDFVTAFDVVDRCVDLPAFVRAAHRGLRDGGLLFIAAPSISGFDLQVLWDGSPTIMPPDKLNLLSVEGFEELFAAPQWDICEFSTPGMFDVESVGRAVKATPEAGWPRFIRYLLEKRDEGALIAFQEYLQTYRLSSFARLVVRKV